MRRRREEESHLRDGQRERKSIPLESVTTRSASMTEQGMERDRVNVCARARECTYVRVCVYVLVSFVIVRENHGQ